MCITCSLEALSVLRDRGSASTALASDVHRGRSSAHGRRPRPVWQDSTVRNPWTPATGQTESAPPPNGIIFRGVELETAPDVDTTAPDAA